MFFAEEKVNKFQNKIQKATNIALFTHKNPDGDAYSSLLSLSLYLDKLNKNYDLYFSNLDSRFDYLKNFYKASTDLDHIDFHQYDLFIFCDLNNLERTGIKYLMAKRLNTNVSDIINIDHHAGKGNFANLIFSDSHASSTTVIIYKLLKQLKVEIDADMATALLTGLLTDTSYLENSASNLESFQIVSELLDLDANLKLISPRLTLNILKAIAEILEKVKYKKEYKLIIAEISDELLDKYNLQEADLAILYYLLLNLKDYKTLFVLKNYKSKKLLKVSLRTKDDNIDLNKFASFFNGGGHKKASAFAISNYYINF